jgi:hypothetical protein
VYSPIYFWSLFDSFDQCLPVLTDAVGLILMALKVIWVTFEWSTHYFCLALCGSDAKTYYWDLYLIYRLFDKSFYRKFTAVYLYHMDL